MRRVIELPTDMIQVAKIDALIIPKTGGAPETKTLECYYKDEHPELGNNENWLQKEGRMCVPDCRPFWTAAGRGKLEAPMPEFACVTIRYDFKDAQDEEDVSKAGVYGVMLCKDSREGQHANVESGDHFYGDLVVFRVDTEGFGVNRYVTYRPTPKEEWAFLGEKYPQVAQHIASNPTKKDFVFDKGGLKR